MKIIPRTNQILKSNIYIIILSLVFTTVFINIAGLVLSSFIENQEILNFSLISFQQIVLIFISFLFIKKQIIKITNPKLTLKKCLLIFFEILKTYFYLMLFGVFLSILKLNFKISLPGFSEQQDILKLFPQSGPLFYMTIIKATILAPILEEIIFRAGLLKNLMSKYSTYSSVIVSSLIFSLIHFQLEVFGALFVISLLISRLYIKTGTIIAPVLFHIINNSIKTIISL